MLILAETIEAGRLWVKTTSFAPYVPRELQSARGYRTDSVDTRIADAILDLWHRSALQATLPTGKKRLAAMAGVSPNTALAAVRRLDGWFCRTAETPEGIVFAPGDIFAEELAARTLTPKQHYSADRGQSTPTNVYTTRRTDDAFMTGTSRTVKSWAKDLAPDTGQTWREWIAENTAAGLGETALRVVDALDRAGDMTAAELADETGKTLGSIRRAARRLEALAVIEAERPDQRSPKTYSLPPEWTERIDDLRPALRTYQLGDGREESRLQEMQCWAERQEQTATTQEQKDAAWRRKERLTGRRSKVLTRLHPSLPPELVNRMAADIPIRQWTQKRAAIAAMARQNEERTAHHAALAGTLAQLADLPAAEQRRMLHYAGYDAGDIYTAGNVL